MGGKKGTGEKASDRNDDLVYALTFKDVVDILEIIDASDGKELRLEVGDLKLDLIKR